MRARVEGRAVAALAAAVTLASGLAPPAGAAPPSPPRAAGIPRSVAEPAPAVSGSSVRAAGRSRSAGEPAAAPRPSLLLVTLDTARADALGSYGGAGADTPALDALAARGTRYARAVSPAPLTLPAHASLLTGLAPPEHGLRDNGTHALPAEPPTLASVLAVRGWSTAAFVSSRVLDRRFGLARGFGVYGDRMAAERVGQYGYPERDAEAVTGEAVEWLAERRPGEPVFLWVHYYDPHAPYEPPVPFRRGTPRGDYAGEVAFVDRQVGRLLAALPERPGGWVVAAVGDHGEAFGEHGEEGHGIFLYRTTLEVPLLLAGPGVPAGEVVGETVGARRLPATLLALLGVERSGLPGPRLPGLPALGPDPPAEAAYSEAWMPATVYGWAPLTALTDRRWKLIVAPRPELYDLAADPGERHERLAPGGEGGVGEPAAARRAARAEARRLRDALREREAGFARRDAAEAVADPALAADLRALGYLPGRSDRGGSDRGGGLDPKDGIVLLARFERAGELLAAGRAGEAAKALAELVAASPASVPFLSRLAAARLAAGDGDGALDAYRRAIRLDPRSEFLRLHLADALRRLGRTAEARTEYRRALDVDPRSAPAWLALAELAHAAGEAGEERRLLAEAVAAGTESAAVHARLGQLALAAGDVLRADESLARAVELAPGWALPWLLWGEAAAARGDASAARERYRRAAAAGPDSREGREARRRLAVSRP